MTSYRPGLLLLILASMVSFTFAQFGIGNMKKDGTAGAATGTGPGTGGGAIDLQDPELIAAMEMFAGMSPDEVEETMKEVADMLGGDPETAEAIREVMAEIPKMKGADVRSSLEQMVAEDEIAAATDDALEILGEGDWEAIWAKQDVILDAVIQSGQISAEDAAEYKSDVDAWEKELRFIWDELQKQAATAKQREL